MKVLVDTNIVLDVLQKRAPHYAFSVQIWNLVENKGLVGYVSAITFNNVFYVLRKQIGSAQALEGIKLIRAVYDLSPSTKQSSMMPFEIWQTTWKTQSKLQQRGACSLSISSRAM